jgi:hypothetical protein
MAEGDALSQFSIAQSFGFSNFQFFGSTFLTVILVIVVAVIIIGLIATLIVLWVLSKQYKFRIPLYTKVGNVPTRVAILKAKPVAFGRAGDLLWFVKGAGIKKWIAPASIQSAKNEFWHWIREDGEWVNFSMQDLDEISLKAGVKYVKQEARLTRLAIDRLLEQRLDNKSFWEKWGVVIGYVIFFLVITIALVLFFHQYSGILEAQSKITQDTAKILDRVIQYEEQSSGRGVLSGLIPVNATLSLILFSLRRRMN